MNPKVLNRIMFFLLLAFLLSGWVAVQAISATSERVVAAAVLDPAYSTYYTPSALVEEEYSYQNKTNPYYAPLP